MSANEFEWRADNGQLGESRETQRVNLVLPMEGSFVRETTATPFLLDPVSAAFYLPGDIQQNHRRSMSRVRMITLILPENRLPQFDWATDPMRRCVFMPYETMVAAQRIRFLLNQVAVNEREVEAQSLTILDSLISRIRVSERSVDSAKRDLCQRAREVILTEELRLWTLEEVAERLCCSHWHLSRSFSEQMGIGLRTYSELLRLRRALHEVVESRVSLTEIALLCGFSSHSHFTDVFRRKFGATPSVMRRQMRQATNPESN